MPRAEAVQPMMFRIPKDVELGGTMHHVLMPVQWDRLFGSIWPPRDNRRERRIPYGSLGDSLRLLFPQTAYIESMNTGKMTNEGWFYGWEKPGQEQFMVLIEEWARAEGGDGLDEAAIDQLDWNDLDWSQQVLTFGQYDRLDNGSPDMSPVHYRALPDIMCANLAGREFEIGEHHPLVFHRAYNGRTPELISWPPIASVRNRVTWYWSFVLTPRIKTIVTCPEPFLYFHPSVRRWASSSLKTADEYYYLSSREDTSAYIEVNDPWMSAHSGSLETSLVGLPLRLRPFSEGDDTRWRPAWETHVDRILAGIMVRPDLPGAPALIEDPAGFLNRQRGAVGITVRGYDTAHRVGTGIPTKDRRDIYNCLCQLLQPYGLTQADMVQRTRMPSARKTSLLRKNRSAVPGEKIVNSIRGALRDRVYIEVLFQTEATCKAVVAEVWRCLLNGQEDKSVPSGDSFTLNGVDIQLVCKELGTLGAKLDRTSRSAEDGRVEQIISEFDRRDIPVGCVVELQGASYFGSGDPKNAIRRGLAETGRLSQFITPLYNGDAPKPGGPMSVRSAVADLLRQFGNLPDSPFDEPRSRFPSDVQALGVWFHRQCNLPLLVHLTSRSQVAAGMDPVRVMLPTGRRTGEWYSYPKALLTMSGGQIPEIRRDQVGSVLQKMLGAVAEGAVVDNVPMLMLCDAQNMRYVWPALQNKNLAIGDPDQMPWNVKGLKPRVVRVNVSEDDVPDWFEPSLIWANGLFKAPGQRTFLSLGPKPASLNSTRWKESKRDRPFDRHASTRMSELVLVQLDRVDDEVAWTWAVHRLRDMAAHYNDTVRLPLPLHLADLTKEYVPGPSGRRSWPRRR